MMPLCGKKRISEKKFKKKKEKFMREEDKKEYK
jgi:hypothetical protein